jgi:hypothetical protein
VMIVPTGSARCATSTLEPISTLAAAAAWGEPEPPPC